MVEIECLACAKAVKLPQFIDIDNYDGQVVCQECKSLLHVKLVKGKVQKYKVVANRNEFNWTDSILRMQKEKNQQEKEK